MKNRICWWTVDAEDTNLKKVTILSFRIEGHLRLKRKYSFTYLGEIFAFSDSYKKQSEICVSNESFRKNENFRLVFSLFEAPL
jgi:hypothetical protein